MSSLKSEKEKKNTIKEFLCIAATQLLPAILIQPTGAQQGALELGNIVLLLLQPAFPGKPTTLNRNVPAAMWQIPTLIT